MGNRQVYVHVDDNNECHVYHDTAEVLENCMKGDHIFTAELIYLGVVDKAIITAEKIPVKAK
jgi:hypothetical protein